MKRFILIIFIGFEYCEAYRPYYNESVNYSISDNRKMNYTDNANKEKIKNCNIRLGRCLAKCDSRYPEYSKAIDPLHAECRDDCVIRLKNEEGCMIFYQSSRRVIHKPGW